MALILRRKLKYDPPHRGGDFAKLLPYYAHGIYYARWIEVCALMNKVRHYSNAGNADGANVGSPNAEIDAGYCLDRADCTEVNEAIDAETFEWAWGNHLASVERSTREADHRTTPQTRNTWVARAGSWRERRSAPEQRSRGPSNVFAVRSAFLFMNNTALRQIGSFGWSQPPNIEHRDFEGNVHRISVGGRRTFYADEQELDPQEWTHLEYLDSLGNSVRFENPYRHEQT